MDRVKVSAGICGFTTTIEAKKRKDEKMSLKMTSDCNEVTELANALHIVESTQRCLHEARRIIHCNCKNCVAYTNRDSVAYLATLS